MISIREAIVVEGKYDKNTLSQVVSAPIFCTDGFGIRNDTSLMALLRRIAIDRGLIVFTDADGAGLVIRNFIKCAIPAQYLKHAYIPEVFGKERRKAKAGKEGKIGVEGMNPDVLIQCLTRAGATIECGPRRVTGDITKQDFCSWKLSGAPNSAQLRMAILAKLGFPQNMSANAMLQAVNVLYSRTEFEKILGENND